MCVIYITCYVQVEEGIRFIVRSRRLGDVYKRQVQGLGFRVYGLGFRVQGSGFRV